MSSSRESQLLALLGMQGSTAALLSELSTWPWDRAHDLVPLSGEHIVNALNCFLAGTVSAAGVEEWARAVESREDIDQDRMSTVGVALYELVHPDRTRALTPARARALIAGVRASAG